MAEAEQDGDVEGITHSVNRRTSPTIFRQSTTSVQAVFESLTVDTGTTAKAARVTTS
jgi:hypothetical protein